MTSSVPTLPLVSDALSASLESSGPLAEATGDEMMTSAFTLWEDGSGSEAGIWSALRVHHGGRSTRTSTCTSSPVT